MAAPINNKYGLGNHNAGRPPLYEDPEAFTNKILEYFTYCEGESTVEKKTVRRRRKGEDGKTKMVEVEEEVTVWIRQPERPTWTKLALYLGFESRQSLTDYAKKEAFSYPIKRALLVIESLYEDGLWSSSPAGVIFALKNLGWVDKSEIEHKGNVGGNYSDKSDDELRAELAKLKKRKGK
ncbi:terminase small subunit [Spirosoma sp. SC4-14]|uniref:terminase small subunit n=1 Tax=Spirosoma sp. SC4-14 TaxID=3128900 RepID=UPI0030D2273F